MNIRLEINEDGDEEVVIKCRFLSDKIRRISMAISEITSEEMTLALSLGHEEYFVACGEILFFETDGGRTAAHTSDRMYYTQHKLYELENLLPRTFQRASKSCIVNTSLICSISHNPVSSSEAKFTGSYKKIYISRNYYKSVRETIEKTRLKLT